MIGNPFERLGKRVVEVIEQAFDKLSPPSSSPSLGLAGATGSVVHELNELSAPVAAKGAPRDSTEGNRGKKGSKTEYKDPAPIVLCEGRVVQISQFAWNKLSEEYRERIRRPQDSSQAALVGVLALALNQVSRRDHKYIDETAARILNYPGRPNLLKQVFDTCQSYDPIALGKELVVEIIPADHISKEGLQERFQIDEDVGDSERTGTDLTVRSDSGAVLRTTPHVLMFKNDPSRIVAIGGRRLMASHSDALFGTTPEVVRARRRRIEGAVGDSLLAPLVGMSLTQILNSDELRASASRSPLLARNLEAFEELMPMLQEAHKVIQNALFGVGLNAERLECLGLKTDVGGQLLSWCEANRDLMPEALQLDLERLLYSPLDLSLKEQQKIIARLATYRVSRSTINLEIALAPLREDLEVLQGLPVTDPLSQPELLAAAEAAIANVVKSVPPDSSNEIRLDRLPDLLSSPMTKFRRALNQRELAPYEEEFFLALQAFKPLFCEGERFKEGFRGESIPVTLLGSTLYGAEIGVRRFEKVVEKRFPALSRNDFYFVREALFYQTVAPDRDLFCTRLSIPRFKELVLGVIAAQRKANDLDNQYRRWFAEQPQTEGLSSPPEFGQRVTGEVDLSKLTSFAPTVLRGTKIHPAEEFTRVYGVDWTHCINVQDFTNKTASGEKRDWDAKAPLERYLRDASLCDFGLGEESLQSLARWGKNYSPGALWSDLRAALEPYFPTPFVVRPWVSQLSSLTEEFARRDIVESALALRSFIENPEVSNAFAPLLESQSVGGLSAEDRKLFDTFLSATFVVGKIVEREGKKELCLFRHTGRQLLGEPHKRSVQLKSPLGGMLEEQVDWFDPSSAMGICKEFMRQSVLTTELKTEPLVQEIEEKTRAWRSLSARAWRTSEKRSETEKWYSIVYDAVHFLSEGNGVGTVDLDTSRKAPLQHWIISTSYPDRISLDLLQTISNWLTEDATIPDGPIGTTGWFEFRGGIPVMAKGKDVYGKAIDDVLYSDRDATFITRFLKERPPKPSEQLKFLIDQMITKKSIVDYQYRNLSQEDRRSVLRRQLTLLFRGLATG